MLLPFGISSRQFMSYPKIIQGGMGAAISNWELAKAVSEQGGLGIVSGTAIGYVLLARLMDGDLNGHCRRALSHFPFQEPVQRVLDKYYVPGGIAADQPYKRPTMWTLNPPNSLYELTVLGSFVEIFLAKEGHDNPVGLNLLEKIQMPNTSTLYGAMLAGVDYVFMGAGIPMQIPGILDNLAEHQAVSYRVDVEESDSDDDHRIHFDPEAVFPGVAESVGALKRPDFIPIISSVVLARALLKRASGKINGFMIELPIAGGHNAPPRGALKLNESDEPIYGEKDVVDLEKMKAFGLPFWLAGGYDTPERLQAALDAGAQGVQIGTAFAYCNESGMKDSIKQAVIQKVLAGEATVHTSITASPTGFPFKVVQLEGTMSEADVYESRPRCCDIGLLQHPYKKENGKVGYRCPSEPVDTYLARGGKIEDTVGRACLCNGLISKAGFAQRQKGGFIEPPIVTSGDELVNIGRFMKPEATGYSAKDVIDHLQADAEPVAMPVSLKVEDVPV
jgi:NAD(P)H-dependent flavin oxidoreductase YrpB (nitropropane dioxygenase family)